MMKVNRSHSIVNNLKDKFEYIGTFLASFHYIFQIPYVIYLTARVKLPFNKIIDNNLDKFLLILLFISGLISSFRSERWLEASLVSLIPFIFIWFYSLGRFAIKNPKITLYNILLGATFLGIILIISKIFKISLYIADFPIVDGNSERGLVLGVRNQGLSVLLEIGLICGIGLLLLEGKNYLLFLTSIFICILGIFITQTRGAIIGIVFAFIPFLLSSKIRKIIKNNWKLLLSLFLILTLSSFLVPSLLKRLTSDIGIFYENYGIIDLRQWIYMGILNMIKDNLFFGVGPGQFIYYYPRYCIKIDPNHPLALDLRSTTTTHSVYFYFLTGWGIIGSFLFFFWLFRQIYLGFKSNKNFSKILILSMIMTFMGHGLVDDIFTVHVPLLIGMLRNQNLHET